MKGSKKMLTAIVATIGSIALISGMSYAADGAGKSNRKPTVHNQQQEQGTLPHAGAVTFTGKVDNSDRIPQGKEKLLESIRSLQKDGKSYTLEELAEKLGVTVKELESLVQVEEHPISADTKHAAKSAKSK